MRLKAEPQILKEILKEVRDVKQRLSTVQSMVMEEELTKQELRQIKKARADLKKGKYVTLEQLKKEIGMK